MDQSPPFEDTTERTHEEPTVDAQVRIDVAAQVIGETLLGMWRSKHRAERRGQAWPPPEEPKLELPRLRNKPPGPPRRIFREAESGHELVVNVLLESTWFPSSDLWLEPPNGKRTRVVLKYGRDVIGVVVLDEYGDAAVLRALAVRSAYRRKGHGRSLVEHIVRHAYQVGVGRMYAASATPWFAEEVGFEVRDRVMLPEDARDLAGLADAPRSSFVFELTPTMSGRRAPRRRSPRSAREVLGTELPRGARPRRQA